MVGWGCVETVVNLNIKVAPVVFAGSLLFGCSWSIVASDVFFLGGVFVLVGFSWDSHVVYEML